MDLKFRCWSKLLNKFITGDFNIVVMKSEKTHLRDSAGYYFCNYDEVELMIYTNMNDCDGKEIYEGDIVLCRSIFFTEFAGEVKFKDGCFIAVNEMSGDCFRLSELEIIKVDGNIYEDLSKLNDIRKCDDGGIRNDNN